MLISGDRALIGHDASSDSFASFFYAALLVMVGMALLPSMETGRVVRVIARTGRESYHVFLVQMLWFSSLAVPVTHLVSLLLVKRLDAPVVEIVGCLVNVAVCVLGGAFFYWMLAREKPSGILTEAA